MLIDTEFPHIGTGKTIFKLVKGTHKYKYKQETALFKV